MEFLGSGGMECQYPCLILPHVVLVALQVLLFNYCGHTATPRKHFGRRSVTTIQFPDTSRDRLPMLARSCYSKFLWSCFLRDGVALCPRCQPHRSSRLHAVRSLPELIQPNNVSYSLRLQVLLASSIVQRLVFHRQSYLVAGRQVRIYNTHIHTHQPSRWRGSASVLMFTNLDRFRLIRVFSTNTVCCVCCVCCIVV
jgi:hypothetical protein